MSNLALRTISGVGFIAVMLCGLLINQYLFAALVLFMMVAMMLEFYRMSMNGRHSGAKAIAIAAGVAEFALLFAFFNWGLELKYIAMPIILLMAIPISAVLSEDRSHPRDVAYIFTGILYIAFPLALSNIIAFKGGSFNARLLLCFFILIWCSDIGAYTVGKLFGNGKRKLAEDISPKKTWVGFFGGLAFCMAAAIVIMLTGLFDFPWYHCLALALIMDIGGVFGDLFESLWKRQCGVKDSGNIIPGHGGMLDRFDSTLVAMPLGAIYLSLLGLL